MKRVYNFAAGPAVMFEDVLAQAADEMLCYQDSGMSVMEMSHRSGVYEAIIKQTEADLRTLMHIPDNYRVLFLQGGASMQFAQIPMNLTVNGCADYINSGNFANNAIKEASRYTKVNVVASSQEDNYDHVPVWDEKNFNPDADYFYITTNNTIFGTRYMELPKTGKVPLVADMSSNILSQEYNVEDFGLIFAGAQKNIGPAGVCVVIVREDLVAREGLPFTPTMLKYSVMDKNGSMYNTPPTYAIYLAGLTFKHLLKMGGVPAMQKINEKKAAILYDFLDQSSLFKACARKESRSIMNVTFVTGDKEKDAEFVKAATAAGFVNVKGHRLVGGMRASIYNAMPVEGVQALVDFMKEYEKNA